MTTNLTTPAKILSLLKAGMPTPASGQTLICKSVGAGTTWTAIHSVTAGKTFYLMGVYAISDSTNWLHYLSFDSGATTNMVLEFKQSAADADTPKVLFTGWPIAQVAGGQQIQVKTFSGTANNITIWGWEE